MVDIVATTSPDDEGMLVLTISDPKVTVTTNEMGVHLIMKNGKVLGELMAGTVVKIVEADNKRK